MSIIERSNETPPTEAPAAQADPKAVEGASVAEKESASAEADASGEQNESPLESETEETQESGDHSGESEADASPEGAETKGQAEADKPRKKNGFQKRIDKLNARVTASVQEMEYWKREALKSATAPAPESKVDQTSAAADGKPNIDSFESHADYVEALTDWKTEQKLKERDQRQAKSQLEIEQTNALKTHASRVESFKVQYDDFDEMMEGLADVPRSPALESIIVSSENGPALLYELAKNPEEAKRIAVLGPMAVAREMGKLEARLSTPAKPTKEASKITKAPRPMDPVGKGGKGAISKSIFDPSLSQRDYERLRAEQMKRRQA
jgi:hypothetical protein